MELFETVGRAEKMLQVGQRYGRDAAQESVQHAALRMLETNTSSQSHAIMYVKDYTNRLQIRGRCDEEHIKTMTHPTANSWADYDTLFRMLDTKLTDKERALVDALKTTPLEEIVKSKRFGGLRQTYEIVHTIKQKISEVGTEVDD